LESRSQDSSLTTVARNKSAAELAQLKQENPMPLRKAKITQEAALRKVEKQRKAAEQATAIAQGSSEAADAAERAAEEAARFAEEAALECERQAQRVEESVRETEKKLQEAMDFLEEVKKKGGISFGAIWWMERELKETQKYLPKSKQKM